MKSHVYAVGASALLLAGCGSVTPVPEQVVGYDTNQIVRFIRCEASEAVKLEYQRIVKTPAHRGIREAEVTTYSDAAVIVYDFTFEITGTEQGSIGVDAGSTLSRGALNLSYVEGGELQRKMKRTFRVSDTFKTLRDLDCKNSVQTSTNWRYPIAGRVGLDEVVKTFMQLNAHNRLVAPDGGKLPTMTSDLFFKTTVSVGVGASVELTPLNSRSLEINKFSFGETGISSKREDAHQVTVALSMPESPKHAEATTAKKPAHRSRPARPERVEERAAAAEPPQRYP